MQNNSKLTFLGKIYFLLPFIPLTLHGEVSLNKSTTEPTSPPAVIEVNPPTTPLSSSVPAIPPSLDNKPSPNLPAPPPGNDRMMSVLDFWFGFLPGPGFFPEDKMSIWFASTPEIDRQIRENFAPDILKAERGEYNYWRETARGRLALILLLDQFPRHIYRDKPQAFMLDRMARAIVLEGMQKGDDKNLYPIERAFFYLPLEHSEDINLQNLSVTSYRQLVAESPEIIQPHMQDFLQSAIMQQQQIARFGRFPHRNTILGRESLPEETVFLMQWGRR